MLSHLCSVDAGAGLALFFLKHRVRKKRFRLYVCLKKTAVFFEKYHKGTKNAVLWRVLLGMKTRTEIRASLHKTAASPCVFPKRRCCVSPRLAWKREKSGSVAFVRFVGKRWHFPQNIYRAFFIIFVGSY